MNERELLFPDPFFSANIYCAGLLDQLIYEGILPFWTNFAEMERYNTCYLWFARYMRGGEHLKIRVHGPNTFRESTETLLRASVVPFLEAHRNIRQTMPDREPYLSQFPIDPEDDCATAYPDQILLPTQYQRVPGIIGRQPLSDDTRLTALFTRSLGIGTEIILGKFRPDEAGYYQNNLRISLASRFFLGALLVFGNASELSSAYLGYHQDQLFPLLNSHRSHIEEQFTAFFSHRQQTVEYFSSFLGCKSRDSLVDYDPRYKEWIWSFSNVLECAVKRGGSPVFLREEYIKDQVLATPFKLLHSLANQVGLGTLNEIYLCDLLLRSLP